MDKSLRNSVEPVADAERLWVSKAQTLARIASLLPSVHVPAALVFTFAQWSAGRSGILREISARFIDQRLAVRSSSVDEDQMTQSQAGRFRTELGVAAHAKSLATAIDGVFRSYVSPRAEDEVLIQPMVIAVRASCVAATHTLDAGAPYFVLDLGYGPQSDAVTRGTASTVTTYIAHDASGERLDADERAIAGAMRELMRLHPRTPLEAEFVFGAEGLTLLQVRPIARCPMRPAPDMSQQRSDVAIELAQRAQSQRDGCGGDPLFGLMPDWNPAELIGSHPRPLALSLFRRLITDSNWRRARALLGYRELTSGDLLAPVAGRPYVDVRLSFNSFLPAYLDSSVGHRIVDTWLERLRRSPALHDKVEFEVADTCVDFDLHSRSATNYAGILSHGEQQEFIERLLAPTRACLDPSRLASSRSRMERLAAHLPNRSDLATRDDTHERLLRSADSAALDFALIARQAFAAESLIRSAQRCGALGGERAQTMRASVHSVAAVYLDARRAAEMESGRSALHEQHGHLRPGTFEISVPTYAMDGALAAPRVIGTDAQAAFQLTSRERDALDRLAKEARIATPAVALVAFFIDAVRGREYAKSVLSRAISLLLESIALRGNALGLDRDTLAWIDLATLTRTVDAQTLLAEADTARLRHDSQRMIVLPPLLGAGDDLDIVRIRAGAANYQGRGIVEAPVVMVDRHTRPGSVPTRCILAIESADPGFDWIFAREPAALVTAFGGPNSHMAIRCAELSCPAVMGCGVDVLRRLARNDRLTIDFDSGALCGTRT